MYKNSEKMYLGDKKIFYMAYVKMSFFGAPKLL
jgi:hypothetical protein